MWYRSFTEIVVVAMFCYLNEKEIFIRWCANGDCWPGIGCADDRAKDLYSEFYGLLKRNECEIANVYQKDYGPYLKNDDTFDFIVVGAGAAGSVVANRLSELSNDTQVLLIEAGGDPPYSTEMMYYSLRSVDAGITWNYESAYDGRTCLGFKRNRCSLTSGKVLGGSTTLNGMIYARGRPYDYDYWADVTGDDVWKFENVLPYFKKSEDFRLREKRASSNRSELAYHGVGGLLTVDDYFTGNDYYHERISAIRSGFEELGVPAVNDNSDPTAPAGITKVKGTIRDGRRCSTAKAFLLSAKNRENLKIAKFTLAIRVLINNNGEAYGIEIRNQRGTVLKLNSRNEIVISAGSYNSPKLLMLSGIGPRDHLQRLGIPIVKSAPVGYNLQEPVNFNGFLVTLNRRTPLTDLSYMDAVYDFLTRSTGELSGIGLNSVNVYANIDNRSSFADAYAPTAFITVTDVRFNDTDLLRPYLESYQSEIVESFLNYIRLYDVIWFIPAQCKVESKGRVLLQSTNVSDAPVIIPNYLDSYRDREVLLKAIELLTDFVGTTAMRSLGARIVPLNVPECNDKEFQTREYWNCTLVYLMASSHHAVGSVKMGSLSDSSAVLDSRLKVKGIPNLRVVDASVMPEIVSGNTNIPTIMIGEIGSDFIKSDYLKKSSKAL